MESGPWLADCCRVRVPPRSKCQENLRTNRRCKEQMIDYKIRMKPGVIFCWFSLLNIKINSQVWVWNSPFYNVFRELPLSVFDKRLKTGSAMTNKRFIGTLEMEELRFNFSYAFSCIFASLPLNIFIGQNKYYIVCSSSFESEILKNVESWKWTVGGGALRAAHRHNSNHLQYFQFFSEKLFKYFLWYAGGETVLFKVQTKTLSFYSSTLFESFINQKSNL